MVRISTVGYGDITPQTIPGMIVVITLILVTLVLLPGLVSDVQENLR
eukprot:jgi/Hompol1/6167/HPOL_002178-RA